MKSMSNFVDGVLQKTAKRRKNKRILNAVISLCVSGVLIFLVAYSNIISLDGVFKNRAYKRFMQSYATAEGDMRLKILDESNAALTVDNQVYTCALSEKNNQTFTLKPMTSDETLTARFENGKAVLTGAWRGEELGGVTLNIVKDMQIQSGEWVSFMVEQYEGGTFSSTFDWFLIDEAQSYCATNDAVLSCKFVAVGDIILQYVKDQFSGVCVALLFEKVDSKRFGFDVISTTVYQNEDGSDFVTTYYKQLLDGEKMQFEGGMFATNIIDYEYESAPFTVEDYAALEYLEGEAPWQLFPTGSISQTRRTDITLTLDLKKNGTLSFRSAGNWLFNTSCGGKWYAFADFVLVVLDKEYPQLGLRAFTIETDGMLYAGDFEEAAVSKIRSEGIYRVGYHTFDYYFSTARATVYWGSGWSDETLIPKLKYGEKYQFTGWYTKEHLIGADAEKIYIQEDEPTILVFEENSSCKWYKGDEHWSNLDYRLREYDEGKFSLEITKIYIYDGDERYGVSRLNIGVNRLFMRTTYNTTRDGKEYVYEVVMEFSIIE